MVSNTTPQPNFLNRAKRIEQPKEENKSPSFLSRGKLIKDREEKFPTPEQDEKEYERATAQLTSRGLEAVLGLPGDLVNFVGGLFGYEPNAPGSEKLKEFSEKSTGGYTTPKTEFEEQTGELMQDVALMALPGAKYYSAARNIGIPIVANLAKEGLKYGGAGEGKQAAGKLGAMVVLDILSHRKNLGTAKEYASSLFQKADEQIPRGLSIKASNLEKSLDTLESSFKAGGERPATGDALKKISEIRNEIKNGKIDMKSLVAYRPAINEWIDKYKGFDIQASPAIRKKIINNLNQVKGEVIKAAEEYGKNYNPEYLKLSKSANEAYAAYAQSNKISNFIEKHAASKLKSTGAKALLGLAYGGGSLGLGGISGASVAASAGAGGALAYKMLKTILRSKSPTLRKHYFNILEGAAKGNASQVIKNAKLLDKEFIDISGEIPNEFD